MPVTESNRLRGPVNDLQDGTEQYLRKCFRVLIDNLEGSFSEENIESLHDFRTNARRIETIFQMFEKCFKPKKVGRQREIFRLIVRCAGCVREKDVFLRLLNRSMEAGNSAGSAAVNLVIARTLHEQRNDRLALSRQLKNFGKTKFEREFIDCITSFRLVYFTVGRSRRKVRKSFRGTGKDLLPRLRQEFATRLKLAIDRDQNSKRLHNARLAGKPLRYAMEMFENVFGKKFGDSLRNVRDLLQLMGEIHDCDIAIATLNQFLKEFTIYNSLVKTGGEEISVQPLRQLLSDQKSRRGSLDKDLEKSARRWISREQRKRFRLSLE
jgi:CHAD domain-containing protein